MIDKFNNNEADHPPDQSDIGQLTSIIWHVINKCNFSCEFCYTNSNPTKPYGLSTRDLLHIVQQINASKIKTVSLIGGEPLIRKDFDILLDAFDPSIALKVDTNASLLQKKWSKSIEKINVYCIGIDGESDVNELDRRFTSAVISAIEFLLYKGKTVNVALLINAKNYREIKTSLKFILQLGVNTVQVNRFLPVIGRSNNHLALGKKEETFAINEIIELIQENPDLKQRIRLKGWKHALYFQYFRKKPEGFASGCKCGNLLASISFDGYFVPCTVLAHEYSIPILQNMYIVPNLLRDSMLGSFSNSQLFKDFRRLTAFKSKKCLSCHYNSLCNHGCRAYSLISTGDLFAHDPSCNISETVSM